MSQSLRVVDQTADFWKPRICKRQNELIGTSAVLLRARSIKNPSRPPIAGCSRAVCALAAGSRRFFAMVQTVGRKCLVVPRVEPAGERTTCRRDRWGQTAVVHLYPRPCRAYPLFAPAPSTSHEMGAQRSPTPFCPFLPLRMDLPTI